MDYVKMLREKVNHEKVFLNCVGAAIFNNKSQVLLQRRADRNSWGFPGGVMELGESFVEAIQREVREETGLVVEVENLVGIYSKYSDEYPNGDKAQPILIFFKCKPISGWLDCENDETLELKYFSLEDKPVLVNQQHEDMFCDLKGYIGESRIR